MTTWMETSARAAVHGRSGGICEVCCAARATDMHHRKSRGVGGQWCPANILHICRGCHTWITEHPQESYARGVSLRSHQEPEEVPVTRLVGLTFLLSNNISPPRKNKRRRVY